MTHTHSVLSRAKKLGAGSAAAIATVLTTPNTEANNLTLDYSFSGEYSNSGWFMQDLRESEADGIVLDNGFKLWGEVERSDSIFWRYSDYWEESAARGDITGFAMAWGGEIIGPTTYDDILSSPYEFEIDFTHFNANPEIYRDTYVNAELIIGYSDVAYSPREYESIPTNISNGTSGYNSTSFSYYEAGKYLETGDLSVSLTESSESESLYWYAMLAVNWNHETYSNRDYYTGEPIHYNLNGDTFKLTVPQNSIDVTYDPILGSSTGGGTSKVPDSGSYLIVYALLGIGALVRARRA